MAPQPDKRFAPAAIAAAVYALLGGGKPAYVSHYRPRHDGHRNLLTGRPHGHARENARRQMATAS